MRYPIPNLAPATWHDESIEIEKSQFIAWVCHAPSVNDFVTLLAAAKQAHPNASHHCSAYIAGAPGEQNHIGFSDDGEPGGTAGRPMFQVINGSGIGEIGCVVTRYFGGTKLGTGGLARAYAQAVSAALETLPTREIVERDTYTLRLTFAQEADARAWCNDQGLPIENAEYDSNGVHLAIGWPQDYTFELGELENRLKTRIIAIPPTKKTQRAD